MIEVYLNPDKGAVLGFRIKKNRTITEWGDLSVDERDIPAFGGLTT